MAYSVATTRAFVCIWYEGCYKPQNNGCCRQQAENANTRAPVVVVVVVSIFDEETKQMGAYCYYNSAISVLRRHHQLLPYFYNSAKVLYVCRRPSQKDNKNDNYDSINNGLSTSVKRKKDYGSRLQRLILLLDATDCYSQDSSHHLHKMRKVQSSAIILVFSYSSHYCSIRCPKRKCS